jgi:hypothetical protein
MLVSIMNKFNKIKMCYRNYSMSDFVRSFYNRIRNYRTRLSCGKCIGTPLTYV